MAFDVGHKKVGGRKKGAPNKKSKDLLTICEKQNFNPIERLIELYPNLPIEKQANVLLQLMTFIYPKRKAVENDDKSSEEATLLFVSSDDLNL